MLKKTKYESYLYGKLPKGCTMCVTGEKSVLFVTGKCSQNCYYCSLSDNKKNKDMTIINEWETNSEKDLLTEISLCSSKGAGVTGGDPLLVIDKTTHLIKLLKKKFGKNFHIHLYTPLKLVSKERLSKLHKAGLDEIRFHPDLDDNKLWERINIAKEFDWDVGVEIPSLPHRVKETKKLVDFLAGKITFLNINELELSDNNFQSFEGLSFIPKDKMSYAIKGSLDAAKEIANYANKKSIKNIHVCTATLKDKYQLRNRIKLRSKKAKKEYDLVSSEGMLVRGAIYLGKEDSKKIIFWLKKEFGIPTELLEYDKKRNRVLTTTKVVETLADTLKKKGIKPAIVEEFPTQDCFPVEINYI
jgi:uncharacterized protein